ncbi:MAG TPA: AbrB/MazE/SpoVT family DNA-binding domain-containing protein [Thermomicrobiales bacterium]|nr:AbrB/MazE/SpoVT family DNA-binding domain-containing protein [Thermomicrobiales bacterium]
MKTTIDASGRLVIPKEIRRQAGLEPGMSLDVRFCNGRIELEPESTPVRLEREGRFLVIVPEGPVEVLTSDMVEATRQAILDERGEIC